MNANKCNKHFWQSYLAIDQFKMGIEENNGKKHSFTQIQTLDFVNRFYSYEKH